MGSGNVTQGLFTYSRSSFVQWGVAASQNTFCESWGVCNRTSKPMKIYNAGIGVVHKPGKVISEVGRKHVHSITSGKKGAHVLYIYKWVTEKGCA